MKIKPEDTPMGGDSKGTLVAVVENFQARYAVLHERYVGHPFDDTYNREVERIERDLAGAGGFTRSQGLRRVSSSDRSRRQLNSLRRVSNTRFADCPLPSRRQSVEQLQHTSRISATGPVAPRGQDVLFKEPAGLSGALLVLFGVLGEEVLCRCAERLDGGRGGLARLNARRAGSSPSSSRARASPALVLASANDRAG